MSRLALPQRLQLPLALGAPLTGASTPHPVDLIAWDDESGVAQALQWDDESGNPQDLAWDI